MDALIALYILFGAVGVLLAACVVVLVRSLNRSRRAYDHTRMFKGN